MGADACGCLEKSTQLEMNRIQKEVLHWVQDQDWVILAQEWLSIGREKMLNASSAPCQSPLRVS